MIIPFTTYNCDIIPLKYVNYLHVGFISYSFLFYVAPSHRSATCNLYIATDNKCDTPFNNKVALKFMVEKEAFERELGSRQAADFSSTFVMGIVKSFRADESDDICSQFARQV